MLYRVEVIADSSGKWTPNGVCYRRKEDAEASGKDLSLRWMAVREWRVVEITEEFARDNGLDIREDPTIYGAGHRVQL